MITYPDGEEQDDEDEFDPDQLDEDEFYPCDDCDLPDACDDFGCAIKAGIAQPKQW